MDYQTFNSHSASFGGQFANPPQPSQFDPPAQAPARLQQANPSFAYGQFPNGHAGAFSGLGGAMASSAMQPGMPQNPRAAQALHHQQQLAAAAAAATQSPYSPAPFAQTMMSPAHQQFAQNRPPATASPAPATAHHSPSALAANGLHTPMSQMAAHTPVKPEPQQLQTPVKAVPPSPVSPIAQARAQDRMATLLEINSILIKEVCDLQTQGKAGQVGPSPDGKSDGDKPQPSKEYVDNMRRLQANLSYLAQLAEKNHKPGQPIQPGPAIMSPPATPVELAKLYTKLQDLFPGWKGQTAQMKQSPGPQRMNSNTSQPPNSAGLQQNWGQNAMASMQQAQQPKVEVGL